MRIGAIGTAIALALAGAQSAWAAVDPPVISGNLYRQNATKACPSDFNPYPGGSPGLGGTFTVCKLAFSAPPRGKQLLIDRVSCSFAVTPSKPTKVYLAVVVSGNDARKHMLEPALQATEGESFYLVNDDVAGYVAATAPRVVIEAGAGKYAMRCQIAGRLRNKP